jgi:hypothetical protein
MLIEVTLCRGKIQQALLHKEAIVFGMTRGPLKDKLKPDKEQVDLCKEISKLCWRLLEGPADIFWDDDVGEVMAWYEKEPGPKPKEPANFWPLWTIEDAITWIGKQGCVGVSIYQFMETGDAEVYFKLEDGNLAFEKGKNLIDVLLIFILKKLKSGAECRKA